MGATAKIDSNGFLHACDYLIVEDKEDPESALKAAFREFDKKRQRLSRRLPDAPLVGELGRGFHGEADKRDVERGRRQRHGKDLLTTSFVRMNDEPLALLRAATAPPLPGLTRNASKSRLSHCRLFSPLMGGGVARVPCIGHVILYLLLCYSGCNQPRCLTAAAGVSSLSHQERKKETTRNAS